MPRNITVTFADGTSHTYQNAPDNVTPDDVHARAEKEFGKSVTALDGGRAAAQARKYDPTEGMSGVEKFAAGMGAGASRVGRAVKQAFDMGANAIDQSVQGTAVGNALRWADDKLGLQHPDQILSDTNQGIADAKRLDEPLVSQGAGKAGNFAGQAMAVAPTMLIPGANTYVGAALIGGGTGALTTEGGVRDRAKGAVFGAAGGVTGKALGQGLSAGAGYLKKAIAAKAAARQGITDAARAAQQAGYVIPPVDVNPSVTNELIGGISGKIKTAQAASAKNQGVTNELAARALGLPADQPITRDALNAIRQQAGQAYNAVRQVGPIQADQQYESALNSIIAANKGASTSFPGLPKSPVTDTIEALKQPTFASGDAVDAIKVLRDAADAAMRGGDKFTAKAYGKAATALEDVIDRNMQNSNAPQGLIDAFRSARQTIAKTYSVENALNPTTGDVSAQALAKALQRGKPLSGELLDVANAATAFPKATQALKQATGQVSPLDFAVSALRGHAGDIATLAARPALRSLQLSGPYQRNMLTPGAGTLTNLLLAAPQNELLQRALPSFSALSASNAAQQ